jgi:1-acyl-sn-glycerol-3-phosphate acyltransferase
VRCLVQLSKLIWLLLCSAVGLWGRRPETSFEGAVRLHLLCRKVVTMMGIECSLYGQIPANGAVVANHLSYLDVLLMSATRPFVMVAKNEVRGWPLFGWLTSLAGTVYVERGGGPATYAAVNAAMEVAYQSGLPVLFFPEGTTTDGSEVLAFRRGLFHSVLNHDVPLRTAAIRYVLEDANRSVEQDVCWHGEMTLAPHLLRLLQLRGVRAEVCFGEEVLARTNRFELAEAARTAVVEMFEGLGRGSQAIGNEAELAKALEDLLDGPVERVGALYRHRGQAL